MIEITVFILASFFAVNMGSSSFAASMATACGSGALSVTRARVIYIFLIIAGAVLFGGEVSSTLSKGIIPASLIEVKALFIILSVAALSLFTANLMHIPQSTSLSTIAAICGVGAYYQQISYSKINFLIVCWVISTLVSFILIYLAARYIYPPRKTNFWVYERLVNHRERLTWFVVLTSLYNVFSQGTNNVANVVGPLAAAGYIDTTAGLWLFGLIFGLGAFVFTGPMKTTSERIVPLGLLTATIINFISGTVTIVASYFGIPQPAVIIYTMAVYAIGSIKNGPEVTMNNPLTKKTYFTWCINPLLTFGLSYFLSLFFLGRG